MFGVLLVLEFLKVGFLIQVLNRGILQIIGVEEGKGVWTFLFNRHKILMCLLIMSMDIRMLHDTNYCSFYSEKSKIRYLQGLCLTSRSSIMHMVRAFPFYLNITSTGGRADTALAEAEASRESIQ